jgi:DNA-binding CsgD family transcriptional regulator
MIALAERPHADEVAVPRNLALVVDTAPASVDQIRQALAACGVVTGPPVPPSDAQRSVAQGSFALVIVDWDCGDRTQGLRLVQNALRSSDASIILIGADVEGAGPRIAESGRCHLLQRPVHISQFRTTIRLALAQRQAAVGSRGGADRRRRQLEDALHQIGALVRRCTDETIDTITHAGAPCPTLRPRERQIVDLLLSHNRVPAVAQRLGISAHTVRNHLKNVYRRCGVHSQQDLLALLKASNRPVD